MTDRWQHADASAGRRRPSGMGLSTWMPWGATASGSRWSGPTAAIQRPIWWRSESVNSKGRLIPVWVARCTGLKVWQFTERSDPT